MLDLFLEPCLLKTLRFWEVLGLSGPISRDTAILSLRYPISRDTVFGEVSTPPKWCDTPPWYLVSHKHICAIPHFATYRAIIVRYPIKTSTKEFCDTIATSIARYEKYRCWASKCLGCSGVPTFRKPQNGVRQNGT